MIQKNIDNSPACQDTGCHYRVLVEKNSKILFMIDPQGFVTYVNPAISPFGGPDLYTGKNYRDLIAPEDRSRVEQAIHLTLNGQEEVVEFRLLQAADDSILVRAACEVIYENGELAGVEGRILEAGSSFYLEKVLEKRAAQLTLLNQIGEKISSLLDIDQVLSGAVDLLQKSFGYFHVAVFVPEPATGDALMTARAGSYAAKYPLNHRLKRGQGMVGWVWENHCVILANDVDHEPAYINLYPDRIPTRSELSVPILAGSDLVGVLDVQSPLANAFDEDDASVIETVANQLAVAMVNARLYAEVRLRLRELEHAESIVRLQRDLLGAVGSAQDYQTTLEELVNILRPLNGIDCGSLYLVNEAGGLSGVAHTGLRPDFVQAVTELPPEAHKTRFAMAGQSGYMRYADLNFDPRIPDAVRRAEAMLSVAVLPLLHQGRVIATLTLGSHSCEQIPAETRGILEAVAAHLGSALARVKAETALSRSEARSRAILQALPDLMIVLDQDGRYLDFKNESDSILLMPAETMIGKTLKEVLPPSVAARAFEALRQALQTRQVQQIEYDLIFADRRERTFEARLSAASDTLVVALVREIPKSHNPPD